MLDTSTSVNLISECAWKATAADQTKPLAVWNGNCLVDFKHIISYSCTH